jgi:hypothetical protein
MPSPAPAEAGERAQVRCGLSGWQELLRRGLTGGREQTRRGHAGRARAALPLPRGPALGGVRRHKDFGLLPVSGVLQEQ